MYRLVSTPLTGMLVHGRALPSIKFATTQKIYIWVERGTVRVKCHTQEEGRTGGGGGGGGGSLARFMDGKNNESRILKFHFPELRK